MDFIPTWIFYLMAAVAGLELGGFATIFIQRWIDEKPILKPGRSRCPSCEEKLGWTDTIPLISYFLLGGRCRHCEEQIGYQYMLVEISCMAWGLALAYACGPTPYFAVHLILGVMLIAGSFIDFETFLLPHRITLGGAAIAIVASYFLPEPGFKDALMGAAVGAGFFWVLQHAYRLFRNEEGLGSGDVKLMLMIGAMVGLNGLPFTILAASLTSAAGVFIYATRANNKGMQTRIPFGPFLSLGCMLYILYGEQITQWWLNR